METAETRDTCFIQEPLKVKYHFDATKAQSSHTKKLSESEAWNQKLVSLSFNKE
jgi:hypothetical protein